MPGPDNDVMSTTQQRLLDAHVAFVVRELTGETFGALVRTEIDWALDRAEHLTLDEVVERSAVAAVAVKYATRVNLAGAIPELVGEITARLRAHPANAMRLDEIVPRARAEEFATKIAELQPLRRRIATVVAESPVVQSWLADYLRTIALWPVAANRRLAGRVDQAAIDVAKLEIRRAAAEIMIGGVGGLEGVLGLPQPLPARLDRAGVVALHLASSRGSRRAPTSPHATSARSTS